MVQQHDDYGSPSLNDLATIEKEKLARGGLSPNEVDRVFRGLFVYSHGVYEMLRDLTAHCANSGPLVTATWSVYLRLLEQVPTHQPNLLGVFIGAQAKDEVLLEMGEARKKVRDMLGTQRLLEERCVIANAKQEQAEDEHALTLAHLGTSHAVVLDKTVLASDYKIQMLDLKKHKEKLEDHVMRLEFQANQVPGLKKDIKKMVQHIREKDCSIHDLSTNLDETSTLLKHTKAKLTTQLFKLGVLTSTKNRLTKSLEATSGQLQFRNQEYAKERELRLDAFREMRALNKSLHQGVLKVRGLQLNLDRKSMKEEDLSNLLNREREKFVKEISFREKFTAQAEDAMEQARAREMRIEEQAKVIKSMESAANRLKDEITQLETIIIETKDSSSMTMMKLNSKISALAEAAHDIASLKQIILMHAEEKEQMQVVAEEASRKVIKAQDIMAAANESVEKAESRAALANEERRRAIVDAKAIEDGLRVRMRSYQKDVEEGVSERISMQLEYERKQQEYERKLQEANRKIRQLRECLQRTNEAAEGLELAHSTSLQLSTKVLSQQRDSIERKHNICQSELFLCQLELEKRGSIMATLSLQCKTNQKKMTEQEELSPCRCLAADPPSFDSIDSIDSIDDGKDGKDDRDDNRDDDFAENAAYATVHLRWLVKSWTTASKRIVALESDLNDTLKRSGFTLQAQEKKVDHADMLKREFEKKCRGLSEQIELICHQLVLKSHAVEKSQEEGEKLRAELQRTRETADMSREETETMGRILSSLLENYVQHARPAVVNVGTNTEEESSDSDMLRRAKSLAEEASRAAAAAAVAACQAAECRAETDAMKQVMKDAERKRPSTKEVGTDPVEEEGMIHRYKSDASEMTIEEEEKKRGGMMMRAGTNRRRMVNKEDEEETQDKRETTTERSLRKKNQKRKDRLGRDASSSSSSSSSSNTANMGDMSSSNLGGEISKMLFPANELCEPPPEFVAAALRRAFAQRIDDPAMWGAMWSKRGRGWTRYQKESCGEDDPS